MPHDYEGTVKYIRLIVNSHFAQYLHTFKFKFT